MQEIELRRIPNALSTIRLNKSLAPKLTASNADTIIRDADTREVVACQIKMPELKEEGRQLARLLRFTKQPWSDPRGNQKVSNRLSGIGSNNITFGHTAPNAMFKHYATVVAPVHTQNIPTANLFEKIAQPMWRKFNELLPDEASKHLAITASNIHPDWWINETPFSSGICNDISVLPYHKDQGNLKDAWSMMLCLRNKVGGGHLHLPEYDHTFAIDDLSLLLFCGQKTVHGVTPFIVSSKESYRFTIVFYTKTQIAKCGPATTEVRRAQLASTNRDDKLKQLK